MMQNRHEFTAIKEFVEDLGLEFRFDALINQRIDRGKDMKPLRILPHEVIDLDLSDPRRGPEFLRYYKRASKAKRNPGLLFRCGAGVNSFHVDPYGCLLVCGMVRRPRYNLRRGSFDRGWHEFLPMVRGMESRAENRCKGCGLISICTQCPGWSQVEHGDMETPVDFLCQVTHRRAEAFGLEVGRPGSQPQHFDLKGRMTDGKECKEGIRETRRDADPSGSELSHPGV
jgi:radical SAM protein with 4Fe4S-binding SPASM domain